MSRKKKTEPTVALETAIDVVAVEKKLASTRRKFPFIPKSMRKNEVAPKRKWGSKKQPKPLKGKVAKIKSLKAEKAKKLTVKMAAKNVTNKKADTNMNKDTHKQALKMLFGTATVGQVMTVALLDDLRDKSGTYRVKATKTGRGKGGSKLVELVHTESGEEMTLGSPNSDSILHVKVDGVLTGFETEKLKPAKEPERNPQMAKLLLEALTPLLDRVEEDEEVIVNVTSTLPEMNGSFLVTDASKARGRAKQIKLTLESVANKSVVELYSAKHSGVITGIQILENDTEVEVTEASDDVDADAAE